MIQRLADTGGRRVFIKRAAVFTVTIPGLFASMRGRPPAINSPAGSIGGRNTSRGDAP
jgi:hypothetical protein